MLTGFVISDVLKDRIISSSCGKSVQTTGSDSPTADAH